MKIEATIKAKPGDNVMVLNYRKRPAQWEPGVVYNVKIWVKADGRTSNSYDVRTDRKVPRRTVPSGVAIDLNVGDDGIMQQKW